MAEHYNNSQNNKYNINYGEGGNFGTPSNIIKMSYIPIYQTEEQIKQLVSSIQPIKNIQLLFDQQTGKSKGICFITFTDINGAESCIRNLHKMPMGKRYLKCEYFNKDIDGALLNTNDYTENVSIHVPEQSSNLTFTMQGNVVSKENIGMDLDINMIESPFKFINSYVESSQLSDPKNQYFLLSLLKQESNNVNGLTLNLLQQFPQLSFLLLELLQKNNIVSIDELKQKITLLNEKLKGNDSENIMSNNKLEQLLNDAKVNGVIDNQTEADENSVQEKVDRKKMKLIKKLLKLTKEEIELLPKQERYEVYELQQRAQRGDFN
jgi:cleavage stimulation factor subunit 2